MSQGYNVDVEREAGTLSPSSASRGSRFAIRTGSGAIIAVGDALTRSRGVRYE
jgi:hypothetical protein